MKRCSCCRKFKPESEFYKNKHTKDGLMAICKQCSSFKSKGYKFHEICSLLETERKNIKTLGGWRINILNHAKERENRFNMIEIGGDKTLYTNDKELFKRRICEIINSF